MLNIEQNIELKNYTTYKVGGPAEYLAEVSNEEELIEALKYATQNNLKVTVLGGGSNVIISDSGLKGLTIINHYIDFYSDKGSVTAGSGMSLKDLVDKSLEIGLTGLEFLANIPGSVGGAVAVNAGCYGIYIDQVLEKARILEEGEVREVGLDYFDFAYRSSKLKKGHSAYILSATFRLKKGDLKVAFDFIKKDRELRDLKHPKDPSCGSFFKNPSRENTAGSLIEQSGLKGYKIGGASVSDKHCNFLINTGEATAEELRNLSAHVRKVVKEKTGYELEEEVQYLGEF